MKPSLKAFYLTICICVLTWSCGGNVEPPEIHGTDIRKTRIMSVAEFKRACWQEGTDDYSMPVKSDDGRQLAVEAVVLANGSNENLSGCLIAGDGSAAIAIVADASTISADFPVGSKITIYPEGLHAGRCGTVFTLGCDPHLNPLGAELLAGKLELTDTESYQPVAMPLSLLDEKEAIFTWQNRLVMLEHVCVDAPAENGFMLREVNGATIFMLTGDPDKLGWDGNTSGEGTVCGIVSTRLSSDRIQWIILPRSGDDIAGFTPSVRPGDPDDPDTPDESDDPEDTNDPEEDEYTADFSTLNGGQTVTGYSGRYVTMRGWEAVNCAIASGANRTIPMKTHLHSSAAGL